MLRWCWSTVRAFAGHDTNTRLSRLFISQILPFSRLQFSYIHADSVAHLVEGRNTPIISTKFHSASLHHTSCLGSKSSEDILQDSNACKIFRSRTGHTAVDTLRQFLSPENVALDCPLIHSPTTLRSLYYRAESRDQLEMLDSKMLTHLIGLFGSLSIDPCTSVIYRVPLISRFLRLPKRRNYWHFVLKIGKYKLERKMSLQASDRFWLMCAELARIHASPSSKHLSGDAYRAILRARTHYHIIRCHSRHPGVHAYYLEALLATQDSRLLDFAACDLSFLLRTHRTCHSQLRRLLYHLVIEYGVLLSDRSQESILAVLWNRTLQLTNETPDLVPQNSLPNDGNLDTTSIARSLSATLFGSTDRLSNYNSANPFMYLLSVFSPAHAQSLRWNSLVLLSIFNSPEVLHLDRINWTNDHAVPQVALCWQVILGLGIVEKLSQGSSLVVPTEDILKSARALYQLWLPIAESRQVSRDLACGVAISFLRMASVLADVTLFNDLQGFYSVENRIGAARTSVQRAFAAHYIAAAVRVQGALPDMVFARLKNFVPDVEQRGQVLVSAVQVLAAIDPSLAYNLFVTIQEQGAEPDARAAHALAVSFARCGAFRQATSLLTRYRFSLEERGIVVSAMARGLRENPWIRHPHDVLVTIVDELATLYRSCVPPEHFRGHLEQLLVVLSRYGRGSQLLPVVFSIFRRLPSFFQPRFFSRYCRMLIQHRQFATARKLLGVIRATHPKIVRSLSIPAGRIPVQTRAFRISTRTTPLRGLMSLGISSCLRQHPHAGPSLGRSLQELLRSGRFPAAKRVFASAAATIPWKQCTALGNILLHRVSLRPTPRNGRRVRKILALLEDLVNNHGFRPDRVTANILVKVMIHWRSAFDSPRLRGLFDQLVRSGYPAADYSPLHPPFGTQQTEFSGSSGFSKLSSPVTFEKHSKPMFKMFIKAFYMCNDVEAAKRVVGILKVEQYKNIVAKEARQRARSQGRIRAVQRNAAVDIPVASID